MDSSSTAQEVIQAIDTSLTLFWGKARKIHGATNSQCRYYQTYPAVYHMLDVAFVAEAILAQLSEREKTFLFKPFHNHLNSQAIILCLIALHDIGKLTPGFQRKIPDEELLEFDLNLYPFPAKDKTEPDHGKSGTAILTHCLSQLIPHNDENVLRAIVTAVTSHHGQIIWSKAYLHEYRGRPKKAKLIKFGVGNWRDLHQQVFDWFSDYFSIDWSQLKIDESAVSKEWVMYFAGLCSVADWIGSDDSQGRFDYVGNYFSHIADRKSIAASLVKQLSLKTSNIKTQALPQVLSQTHQKFETLFDFSPNPLQQLITEISLQKTPSKLTIVETPMGSGKTESALFLAESLMRYHGYSGFYIAMPSQATANQLYSRTLNFLKRLPDTLGPLQCHLLHSNAALNEKYDELKLSSIDFEADEKKDLKASQWFTGRKKGFISSMAVGTIDQALMAGLKTRHQFVRLFSLSGRALCIDECHAVDAFQLKMLCNLMQWAGELDVPVILLSATLPQEMRQQLFQAYTNNKKLKLENVAYPRVNYLDNQGEVKPQSLLTEFENFNKNQADENKYTCEYNLNLRAVPQQQAVQQMAQDAIEQITKAGGGVATCIVNTVDSAQRLAKKLKRLISEQQLDIELLIFHARYPFHQRQEKEELIVELLGPNKDSRAQANSNRPKKGFILLGTSVLEQSLNYCSDIFFTEIAPIDLILQRLGRLHRLPLNNRYRPELFKLAKAYIYLPDEELTEKNQELWLSKGTAFIYPKSVLFKTIHCLKALAGTQGQFPVSLPSGIDELVAKVYDQSLDWENEGLSFIAEDWCYLDKFQKTQEQSIANSMLIKAGQEMAELFEAMQEGYLDADELVTTRLALPSITLIFLSKNEQGQWCPVCDGQPIELQNKADKKNIKRLKMSAINISHPEWQKHFSDENYQSEFWLQTPKQKAIWQKSHLLFGCVPVCLDSSNEYQQVGTGKLILDKELGLCW